MWKAFSRRKHTAVQVELLAPAPATATPAPPSKADTNREFFEDLWKRGDYWQLESDPFEQGKYAKQIQLIGDRRYRKVLEIGCGAGAFTRMLAPLSERVIALDVSPAAVARAKAGGDAGGVIEFRVGNVMEFEAEREGPFDLIVIAETIYYLGWLYTFFEVSWLAGTLFDATAERGRLIMTNTGGVGTSYLHRPWILASYRDLFRNVGFGVEREEIFSGEKDSMRLEAGVILFEKPVGAPKVCD